MPIAKTVCQHCGLPLHFEAGRGWVHPGGGLYIVECPYCGEQYDTAERLIQCKRCCTGLRDNHCALAVQVQGELFPRNGESKAGSALLAGK